MLDDMLKLFASGISPVGDAEKDRGAIKNFDAVRERGDFLYASKIETKSETYRTITRRALDKDIIPAIGNKSMSDVTAADVMGICDRGQDVETMLNIIHMYGAANFLYEIRSVFVTHQ